MNSFLTEARKENVSQTTLNGAANVILSYCMAATFLLKNKGLNISREHFFTLADNYLIRGRDSVNFSSMETASNTHDNITLRTPMSDEIRAYIINTILKKEDKEFSLLDSIINFLNDNENFNSLVAQVTNNGLINRIIIDLDNISTEEPTITTVLIDNEQINVFDSMMPIYDYRSTSGGIGQRDLQKDYGYESHRNFLEKSFGIDIGTDSGVYYQTAHNNNNPSVQSIDDATRKLYEELCKKINQGFNGAYDSTLSDYKYNIISSMINSCYGVKLKQQCTSVLIPRGNKPSEVFNVEELTNKIYTTKLEAKCPVNNNPSIRIFDENKDELFQLRFKKERYKDNITGYRYKMFFKPTKLNKNF